MFIDSHCHLDRVKLDSYPTGLQEVIHLAKEAKVDKMLCVAIDLENIPAVLNIAEQFEDVFASVGVHPTSYDGASPSVEGLCEMASHSRVIAIGETGLDYYYDKEHIDLQHEHFEIQLKASAITGLPTIVHTRDARSDTLNMIKTHGDANVAGVLHCFTESWDMAKAAMDMNYFISFSGIVTFKNAKELQEVAKKVPLDRILIETDSPYLAPVPFRGKSNEPKFVPHVAHFLAELRNVAVEEIAEHTTDNFYRLFKRAASID